MKNYFERFVKLLAAVAVFYALSIILELIILGHIDDYKIGYSWIAWAAIFCIVYPKFGFTTKEVITRGRIEDGTAKIKEYMDQIGFSLMVEDGNVLEYRRKSALERFLSCYNDRVVITFSDEGFSLEGRRRDVSDIIIGYKERFLESPNEKSESAGE